MRGVTRFFRPNAVRELLTIKVSAGRRLLISKSKGIIEGERLNSIVEPGKCVVEVYSPATSDITRSKGYLIGPVVKQLRNFQMDHAKSIAQVAGDANLRIRCRHPLVAANTKWLDTCPSITHKPC